MTSRPEFNIVITKPRGFCAGVVRAVEVVREALRRHGAPVYVRHAIVHNRHVVEELEREGARFVENIRDIPQDAVTVFSAHGVSPQIREEARALNLRVLDATCPLVTKVHLEAVNYAKTDYTILLIGHRGHVEVEGTMGEAPDHILLIETVEDAERAKVKDPSRLALITQTTLSIDDTREIVERLKRRFPDILIPSTDDICYATQKRQDAAKKLCGQVDLILVIGSPTSSNSNRLKEVAEKAGCRAFLIEQASQLKPEWFEGVKAVGVTSGASTPEILVKEVLDRLIELGGRNIQEAGKDEDPIRFQLPRELQ